jgi:putative membrane protein
MNWLLGWLIKVVATAVALWAAATWVDGISLTGDGWADKAGTLVLVGLIFGIVNAVLKPIIKTVGCALYILTLGLIGLVVNGLLFLLVGWFADDIGLGFHVDGFKAGFWGAIVVWIVSFILGAILDTVLDRDKDDDD